jgi:hypothetical protein
LLAGSFGYQRTWTIQESSASTPSQVVP